MKKNSLIKLLCIFLTVIFFLGVWYNHKIETYFNIRDGSVKDIFLILLAVPVSILAINVGVDPMLKAQEEKLREKKLEDDKRDWDERIQPLLLQKMLNTSMAAFNTLESIYEVNGNSLIIQWEQTETHQLKRDILRYRHEKQNYLMYFGWFLNKMSLTQTLFYRKFEGKLDTLDYWLLDVIDNQERIDWSKLIRVDMSIRLIFDFLDKFLLDEESRLLRKMATEMLGTPYEFGHIFRSYQFGKHDIELEDLSDQQMKLTYSKKNFFRADAIFKEYAKAFNGKKE